MNKLSYTIHKPGSKTETKKNFYLYDDLVKMTTYQLREISYRERLVKNTLSTLSKEELVRLIMRFRGKKEAALINSFIENGLEILEDTLKRVNLKETMEQQIRVPAKLVLYQDTDLNYFDRCYIKTDLILDESNILLVDEQNKVYSVFNLKKGSDNVYYIEKNRSVPIREIRRKQYSVLYFGNKGSDVLYDLYYGNITTIPTHLEAFRIPVIDVQVKELEAADVPLIIDFGSSNTTVGIFGKQEEYKIVSVLNKTTPQWEETTVIPSTIGIKEIHRDWVDYRFGYEALEIARNNYLDEELPIFYDIKRWINDIERKEKVMSVDGAYIWLKRGDLLKVYLEYIIRISEQRFKKKFRRIQILSPVRQREKFRKIFQQLLVDYEVDCSLDEGVAVLFHSIKGLIKSNQYEKNHWYKALIIDCGGGTTDLTSSIFKIDNNRVSYQISLESSYENGDTNFGGNNLTYRIFQLLKTRLAGYFTGNDPTKNMMCLQENNFRFIDEHGVEAVYEQLEQAYAQAESVIPTKFHDYEQSGANEYFKVKNNFFYLYELAEEIKKVMFTGEDYYELLLTWKQKEEPAADFRRAVVYLDKWKIAMKSGGKFLNQNAEGELLFRLFEIRALLMVDVYGLIRKFMEDDFENGALDNYELIKLTGQSCQASLFVEAMKEYIPGRILHSTKKQKDPHELKVCCLDGALFYLQSKVLGYMDVSQQYEGGALPYELTAYTHEGYEKVLVAALHKADLTGHISRFMEGEQIEIHLRDPQGSELRNYFFHYTFDQMRPTTFEEIEENYPGKLIQDETDNIINGESKFFVWAEKKEWGFYILPVLRKDEILYGGDACFYDFEDDTWELNFFDGTK